VNTTTTKSPTQSPAAVAAGLPVWVPNATWATRPAELDKPLLIEAWLEHGMRRRRTIHFYGQHGVGKTAAIVAYFARKNIAVVYINLANITPDDKIAVCPVYLPNGEIALKQMLMEDMDLDVPFVIYLDDGRQASQKVQNQFMQLTNDWSIGLHTMPHLVGVVMSDNEGAAEGIRTSEDPAVGDRKVTIRLGYNDTGWRYALAAKYSGVDLTRVFRIVDGLPPALRHVLSPRCLDHVLYCALNGFPAIYGLPIMGDQRLRLVGERSSAAGKEQNVDRTREILEKITDALGVRYLEETSDVVRKVVAAALSDRLTVLIQGPPGCGKTALTKDMVRAAGVHEVYYSMPFTDPEALVVPMPTAEGKLKALIAEELRSADPYAIIWDEYNRPSSPAAFAKLMEATQQWSIAGLPLSSCKAQIALCNPTEFQGRRMSVSKNNIAQADRFTISIQVSPDDIPANEWLLNVWPLQAGHGDPESVSRAKSVMETVIDWFKTDIGNEHRDWITKRTLQRLAELALDGLPLINGLIYLGEGEHAPVSLVDLEARLAERPMARLKEISSNLSSWEAKLRLASETSAEGNNDVDQVHQAFALAELSQLWEYKETVVTLLRYFPPRLKSTFFMGAAEKEQEFWIQAMSALAGRTKVADMKRKG
jgi:hypothetical protein